MWIQISRPLPTWMVELVTEGGVLTLNRVVQLLRRYVKNETVSEDFSWNWISQTASMVAARC